LRDDCEGVTRLGCAGRKKKKRAKVPCLQQGIQHRRVLGSPNRDASLLGRVTEEEKKRVNQGKKGKGRRRQRGRHSGSQPERQSQDLERNFAVGKDKNPRRKATRVLLEM